MIIKRNLNKEELNIVRLMDRQNSLFEKSFMQNITSSARINLNFNGHDQVPQSYFWYLAVISG